MKSFRFYLKKPKKKKKFLISLQFEVEVKNLKEAVEIADKLKYGMMSIKEKHNVRTRIGN